MKRDTFERLKKLGIDFDDDFENMMVKPLEKLNEDVKISHIQYLKKEQKNDSFVNFTVKIFLSSPFFYVGASVEIDGRTFQAYRKNDRIDELNVLFVDVYIDFSSVVRFEENFKLTVSLMDINSNKITDTKSINVKVDRKGNVAETNERVVNDDSENKEVTPIDSLTLEQLIAIGVSKKKAGEYIDALNRTLHDYSINTDIRIAHFLAQVMHESGSFNFTSEQGATDIQYNGFKGRGLIQLTWKENYLAYQDYESEDFTSSILDKQKLEKVPFSVRSAGWFWGVKSELNDNSDDNDFIYCTYKVNGGFNGFDLRLKYLKKMFKVLNSEYIDFNFQDSRAYIIAKASFAWGIWNDPDIKSKHFDTCKSSKQNAIDGYKRFLELVPVDYDNTNWYGIHKLAVFSDIKYIKGKKTYVKIREAASQRLEKLQKL